MNEKLLAALKKAAALILALLTPILTAGLTHKPAYSERIALASSSQMSDGFIKGVCHASEDYDLIKQAGIEWVRLDLPFPFEKGGGLTQGYKAKKELLQRYADNGIKVFAITPYPGDYIEYGLDPRDEGSEQAIADIARFFVNDLKGLVGAFQITNEMGIDRFTLPLTLDEAARFIGIQLEAMYPIRGDVLIGYNLGGLAIAQLPFKMLGWHRYCDYVGVDIYLGCFEDIAKEIDQYIVLAGFVRKVTRRPIILCEFGYIGYGEPKTQQQKQQILRGYGFESESEATESMELFISRLPEKLRAEILRLYPDYTNEQYAEILFNGEYTNHLYQSLPEGYGLNGYAHTPEGQGEFYRHLLNKINECEFIIGAVIYCWADSERCYVCGQSECPVETGWGLVTADGTPKPSYEAVKSVWAS